jgi:hypothetical protein
MNSGIRIIALFVFPIVSILACAALTLSLPELKPFVPERPQFLGVIDGLGVSSGSSQGSLASERIRNVFAHEDITDEEAAAEDPAAVPAPSIERTVSRDPVSVTMVVDGPQGGFAVVNGKKMHVGERSGGFALTAIGKDSVTLRYTDGIEETIHVKAY